MAKGNTKDNDTAANVGFKAKLWAATDALRNNTDAAECKHVLLGPSFLKYIPDTLAARAAMSEPKPPRMTASRSRGR